jgi:hypothetical protein
LAHDKKSRAAGLFAEFLKKFPDSPHAQEARDKLQALPAARQSGARRARRIPNAQHERGPGTMLGPGRSD